MWKAQTTLEHRDKQSPAQNDDDWETDPDFINDVSEKEQRYTSRTIPSTDHASGRVCEKIDLTKLQQQVINSHALKKKEEWDRQNDFSKGYGGKFGLQNVDQAEHFLDNKRHSSSGSKNEFKTVVSLPANHGEGLRSIKERFQQKISESQQQEAQSLTYEASRPNREQLYQPARQLDESAVERINPEPPALLPKPRYNLNDLEATEDDY